MFLTPAPAMTEVNTPTVEQSSCWAGRRSGHFCAGSGRGSETFIRQTLGFQASRGSDGLRMTPAGQVGAPANPCKVHRFQVLHRGWNRKSLQRHVVNNVYWLTIS